MSLSARDLMWSAPPMIPPETTLKEAAGKMNETNAGVLPVGIGDRLQGIITDRDIVVRAIAQGEDPEQAIVSDFMTTEIYSCREDDSIVQAAKLMKENDLTRLVVINDDDALSGILSFGHIFRKDASAAEAADIVNRAGSHTRKD